MLKTKLAPRKASSKILDKKWKEHNYMLHRYRLRAMYGDPGPKPNYHANSNIPIEPISPPEKRKALSAKPLLQQDSTIPSANVPRRPYTSKEPNHRQRGEEHNAQWEEQKYKGRPPRPVTTRAGERRRNGSARPPGNNYSRSPRNSSSKSPWKSSSAQQRNQRVGSAKSDNAIRAEMESRPMTSSTINERNSARHNGRVEKPPPRRPMIQQWMRQKQKPRRPTMTSRYKSEYSRDQMNAHYKKHQYLKNSILHKSRPKVRLPTQDSSESEYSEQFEDTDSTEIEEGSGDENEETPAYIPSPTPTPEPVKEVEKLDMEDQNFMAPPTPVVKPVMEYPKVEINYTPPSHVLKIVDDARDYSESDWSEDEPIYVLKDGQRGTFILKDDKYYLSKLVKERRKKRKLKIKESKIKENEHTEQHIKQVHYINYEDDEEEKEEEAEMEEHGEGSQTGDGEQEQEFDEEGNVIIKSPSKTPVKEGEETQGDEEDTTSTEEQEGDDTSESELDLSEYDSEGAKIEKPPKPPKYPKKKKKTKRKSKSPKPPTPVYIHYETSEDEREKRAKEEEMKSIVKVEDNEEKAEEKEEKFGENEFHEIDYRDETDEEEEAKQMIENESDEEEELSNLRPETVQDDKFFDAKKVQDSDSDLDEFGRLKDRQRPSSAMFDFLPPLKPDVRLDGGDITNCKNRLSRHVVIIREALARNEQNDLETAIDVIIANNSDNRRWLRKIYRDSYLQSLLLDLRKTLPADLASVISYMMIPLCEFDAMCLWDGLKGLHKDPEVLCEILCTRTNKELEQIRMAYALRYDCELIDHIEDETISAFQRMLMKLASGQREETKEWTKADAAREAVAISAVLETRGEHCTKKLIEVFCMLPIEMLRCIINEYKKLKNAELDVELIKNLKGNFQRCIITIIHYIQNPPNYFVEKIHGTHFGKVDDDKGLCRLIISRSEPEMIEMIKQLFILRYDMSLYDYIDRTCKGPLRGLVLRIVAGQLTDQEREMYEFPPLWPGREDAFAKKRLSIDQVIMTTLRRAKVTAKMERVLFAYQEQQRLEEGYESEEVEESEEEETVEQEEEEEDVAQNSEDEEAEEERAAQVELKNNLKNISFSDDVKTTEDDSFISVYKDISFANASRGILKNAVNGPEEEENVDEEDKIFAFENLDEAIDNNTKGEHNLAQLNGPVLDPSFTGRGNKAGNQTSLRIPFRKNKKKGGNRVTVPGISMEYFNALKDAQAIGKALLQKKRNIEGLLQFMTTRNNAQRQLIIREFFRRYRRDLVDDLRTLAPRLEGIGIALLLGSEIFDSASLFAGFYGEDSMKCVDTMIEILCTRQNDEIAIIRRAFKGVFGLNMQEEIEKMTTGHCQRLLCAIAECQRDESETADEPQAKLDAQTMYEAVILRPPDLNKLVELFSTRSFVQLAKTCDEFALLRRADILEVIHQIAVGTFKEAIVALICASRDVSMYFCERIYKSMAYQPQDLNTLVRICVSRSEIDLGIIKGQFRRTYGRTIYSMIEKDTCFEAKKILLDVVKK